MDLADDSVYPIKNGHIIRLTEGIKKYNPKLKAKADHIVVIWVLRVLKKKTGKRRQDQKVAVYIMHIPTLHGRHRATIEKQTRVTFRYLTKLMAKGYTLIDDNTPDQYNVASSKSFFNKVGKALKLRFT